MFLKVLMLTRSLHLRSVLFPTIGIFYIKSFRFQPTVCSGCYKLFMMSININNITILNINAVNYHCIIVDIDRSEAISLLENVIC